VTARLPAGRPDAVVFLGTPDAAVPSLVALHRAGLPLALVVTRPDARRGRREAPSASPVKLAAEEMGLPVSHDLGDALVATRRAKQPLGVVVAYGRLVAPAVLDVLPMVNLHFSLLPRWRGAAPVERAILAGDRETGACVMELVAELDAGPLHSCVQTDIGDDESAAELRARLATVGAEELARCCSGGFGVGRPQEGAPTHAAKIAPSDLRIDWAGSAEQVIRQVRVGGAHTVLDGVRTRILAATRVDAAPDEPAPPGSVSRRRGGVVVACGIGAVELVTVQAEGRRGVDAAAWWNGVASSVGRPVRFG
jgi:methionyl-tRNA formyltransferase